MVPPPLCGRRKNRQELSTCLRAPPAHLGGDAAVFMVSGMQLTLLGARDARGKTGLDDRSGNRQIDGRATRQDGRRGGAHIGTVEVCPDALDQRDDIGLCHAGIGTRGAGLEAGDTFFDALDQCVIVGRRGIRVGVGDLSDSQGHGETFRCLELGSVCSGETTPQNTAAPEPAVLTRRCPILGHTQLPAPSNPGGYGALPGLCPDGHSDPP